MIPVTIMVFVWAIIALAFGVLCAYAGFRFMSIARQEKHAADDFVRAIEIQTRKEFNKIATLSPSELSRFLTVIFSRKLILCSDQHVSEHEPNAHETLYAYALGATLEYLGPETVEAIDYYYGKDYINRWCHEAYLELEHSNVASSIIAKERDAGTVARQIRAWE